MLSRMILQHSNLMPYCILTDLYILHKNSKTVQMATIIISHEKPKSSGPGLIFSGSDETTFKEGKES